nr:HU family DNA-binding protein [uncultured Bacteroides sp.]
MSAYYVMKEMPDLNGNGKKVTYPQMVMTGQTSTHELAEYIALKCAFSRGVTEGVICELGEALAHEMGMGRSVKIEGLGVFTPALALHPDKKREEDEESTTKRNAQSIYVGNVNFRVERALLRSTNSWCRLSRAPWKPARSSQKHTAAERLALAQAYLEKHPYLNVYAYRHLTGLLQTAATTELRKWAQMPESNITTSGRGSHKVYVKKENLG